MGLVYWAAHDMHDAMNVLQMSARLPGELRALRSMLARVSTFNIGPAQVPSEAHRTASGRPIGGRPVGKPRQSGDATVHPR